MHPDDQEFVYERLSVIYKHRRSLQDRRHLLVVFSGGFGPKRGYDLNGSVVAGIPPTSCGFGTCSTATFPTTSGPTSTGHGSRRPSRP